MLLGIVASLSLPLPGTAGTNECLSCHTSVQQLEASMEISSPTQAASGCQSLDPKAEG